MLAWWSFGVCVCVCACAVMISPPKLARSWDEVMNVKRVCKVGDSVRDIEEGRGSA